MEPNQEVTFRTNPDGTFTISVTATKVDDLAGCFSEEFFEAISEALEGR